MEPVARAGFAARFLETLSNTIGNVRRQEAQAAITGGAANYAGQSAIVKDADRQAALTLVNSRRGTRNPMIDGLAERVDMIQPAPSKEAYQRSNPHGKAQGVKSNTRRSRHEEREDSTV